MQESPGESPGQTQSPIAGPSSLRKWAKRTGIALLFIAAFAGAYFWWNKREPQAPTEIFQGVTYGCEYVETPADGSGLIHWVRVDLTAPGISLYVTPLEPS